MSDELMRLRQRLVDDPSSPVLRLDQGIQTGTHFYQVAFNNAGGTGVRVLHSGTFMGLSDAPPTRFSGQMVKVRWDGKAESTDIGSKGLGVGDLTQGAVLCLTTLDGVAGYTDERPESERVVLDD